MPVPVAPAVAGVRPVAVIPGAPVCHGLARPCRVAQARHASVGVRTFVPGVRVVGGVAADAAFARLADACALVPLDVPGLLRAA